MNIIYVNRQGEARIETAISCEACGKLLPFYRHDSSRTVEETLYPYKRLCPQCKEEKESAITAELVYQMVKFGAILVLFVVLCKACTSSMAPSSSKPCLPGCCPAVDPNATLEMPYIHDFQGEDGLSIRYSPANRSCTHSIYIADPAKKIALSGSNPKDWRVK